MLRNRPAALFGAAVLAGALAVTGCAASAASTARPDRRGRTGAAGPARPRRPPHRATPRT